ncbi:MAG: hypothetical protein JNL82_11550 [Myxococcales bacterium]|nr:hypothetical protein [Myxococcales bacterium]
MSGSPLHSATRSWRTLRSRGPLPESRRKGVSRVIGRITLLGALLLPAAALAGNGTHPRTPVSWNPRPPCMTIVDRTVSPELEFTYTIPYEDLRPADAVDEVDDSRQHQFLAFCRSHSVQEYLPVWLSDADVVAADAKGLVDAMTVTTDDVFDTSPDWANCFVRITADDQRRVITFAETSMPVVWDTTGLPVGPYVIDGYTWEPPGNLFSLRPGVVKVIDDPDPAMSPPALAISNQIGEEIVWQAEQLKLFGCLSAMDGSTITGYWAATDNPEQPLEWQSFEADTPVSGDEFELMFSPPPEAIGQIVLRIDIKDPMDRVFTAHMDLLASVLPGSPPTSDGDTCDSDSAGFIAMPGCGGTDDGSTGIGSSGGENPTTTTDSPTGTAGAGSSSEGSTGAMETPTSTDGCACTTGSPGSALVGLLLMWPFCRRRCR